MRWWPLLRRITKSWNLWWCICITTYWLMNALTLIDTLVSLDSNAKKVLQILTKPLYVPCSGRHYGNHFWHSGHWCIEFNIHPFLCLAKQHYTEPYSKILLPLPAFVRVEFYSCWSSYLICKILMNLSIFDIWRSMLEYIVVFYHVSAVWAL